MRGPPIARPVGSDSHRVLIFRGESCVVMAYLPVVWFLCAMLAARVGAALGHENWGFCLGLVLGPLGLLVVATWFEVERIVRSSRPTQA
jgi:hypothetical protein